MADRPHSPRFHIPSFLKISPLAPADPAGFVLVGLRCATHLHGPLSLNLKEYPAPVKLI
jgi:hypothetical protein